MIKLIAVVDANFGVSKNGRIPWHFRDDILLFREKTENCVVVMGKNTYCSLPNPPLKNRINCVVSKTMETGEGVEIFRSIEAVVAKYGTAHDVWVIGGAQLFNGFLKKKLIESALITQVHKNYNADTFIDTSLFPHEFSKKILFECKKYSFIEYCRA
jgi:dihydrofolate reductase